ncbi:hypothetical protein PQ43W_12 [Ralstonia phage PQ43W]
MNKTAIALALLAFAASAHAYEFEIGAGQGQFQTRGDGIWYQEGAPHYALGLHDNAFSIGARQELYRQGDFGVRVRAEYVFLGRIAADCTCTPMDQNYDAANKRIVQNFDVPLARFVGRGDAQGIALTIEPYVEYRGWHFGVEGGLFPYRPNFTETIYGWQGYPGMAPHDISVGSGHAPQLGSVVGVRIERGDFAVSLRHYWLPMRDSSYPPIYRATNVVMLTYRF